MRLEFVKQKIAKTILMGLPALMALAGALISRAASVTGQPNIVNVQLKSGAAFISGGGNVGEIYYLQATTNLADPTAWATIGANAADLQGNWQFTDSAASNCPMRFYRLFRQTLPNHATTPLFPMGMLAKGDISFSSIVGTIYAPEADYMMNGTTYIGASVTKTVTMQGGGNFHFDENVRNAGPLAEFVTGNSTEITP